MGQARGFVNNAACGWSADPYYSSNFCFGSQQSVEYSTFTLQPRASKIAQSYFWGPNANYNSVHTLSFLIMLSGKERECALTMLSRVGERVNTVL